MSAKNLLLYKCLFDFFDLGQLGAVALGPTIKDRGWVSIEKDSGSARRAKEAAHCRIVMAEGRRIEGQPTLQ